MKVPEFSEELKTFFWQHQLLLYCNTHRGRNAEWYASVPGVYSGSGSAPEEAIQEALKAKAAAD